MSLSAANIKRAQLLMHGLQASGVEDYVLSPGSRNTPLVLALEWLQELRGKEHVRIHRILDERSAAFFALGLGRINAVPAALVCTSGTAGAHYFPAVIEASQSSIPLLILTADRPEELRGVGSLQTIDQNKLYGDYTRLYLDMGTPSSDGPADAWVVASAARAQAAAAVVGPEAEVYADLFLAARQLGLFGPGGAGLQLHHAALGAGLGAGLGSGLGAGLGAGLVSKSESAVLPPASTENCTGPVSKQFRHASLNTHFMVGASGRTSLLLFRFS